MSARQGFASGLFGRRTRSFGSGGNRGGASLEVPFGGIAIPASTANPSGCAFKRIKGTCLRCRSCWIGRRNNELPKLCRYLESASTFMILFKMIM